jgi:hypothetical protein
MMKLSFEQRFIVARVLNRHAAQHESTSLDKPVFAALERWIEAAQQRKEPWTRSEAPEAC